MATSDRDIPLESRVRVMQIITLALAMGIVSFMIVAIVIRQQQGQPPATSMVTYLALGYAPIMLILQLSVPKMVSPARKPASSSRLEDLAQPAASGLGDVGMLCNIYQTRLIVAAALLEGAAFFALVAYLTEGNILTLIVAVVMLGCILARFPTVSKVERWIEQERQAMQFGG